MNRELHKCGSDGLYSVQLTLDQMSAGSFYYYNITVNDWLITYHDFTSDPITVKTYDVHRDICLFEEKSTQPGFRAYLKHIIDGHKSTFNSRCMQIERLCHTCPDVSLKSMVACITQFINRKDEEPVLLSALAIILISKSNVGLVKRFIKKDEAQIMPSVLCNKRLEMFPSSCHHAMITLSKTVCEIANPTDYTLCLFIRDFFGFLGKGQIKKVLEKHFESSTIDICGNNDSIPDDIFQSLHDSTCLKQTEEIKEIFLRHLPVKVSIQLYLTYCSEAKDDNQFIQSCKSRCLKELNCLTSQK